MKPGKLTSHTNTGSCIGPSEEIIVKLNKETEEKK